MDSISRLSCYICALEAEPPRQASANELVCLSLYTESYNKSVNSNFNYDFLDKKKTACRTVYCHSFTALHYYASVPTSFILRKECEARKIIVKKTKRFAQKTHCFGPNLRKYSYYNVLLPLVSRLLSHVLPSGNATPSEVISLNRHRKCHESSLRFCCLPWVLWNLDRSLVLPATCVPPAGVAQRE